MKIKLRFMLSGGPILLSILIFFFHVDCSHAFQLNEKDRMVLDLFQELSNITRCPGRERGVAEWLLKWAGQHHLQAVSDWAGNVLILVPASSGYEKAPMIVLQSHMDMICEKTANSRHDFSNMPIRFVFQGDWLSADQTTLGADDGIGMALMLSLAQDSSARHPALELLFTVGEETGMRGVNQLDLSLISGSMLINLDSEEEGLISVGSAGGLVTAINLKAPMKALFKESDMYTLRIEGLHGGHSGVDIHKKFANAVMIMARALEAIKQKTDIQLMELKSGSLLSSIPTQAQARIAFAPADGAIVLKSIRDFEKRIRREYDLETGLTIAFSPLGQKEKPGPAFSVEDTRRMISMLTNLPNGVATMDPLFPGSVETSNNLGIAGTNSEGLTLVSFQRSSNPSRLDEFSAKIRAIAKQYGADSYDSGRFDPWRPNPSSDLLQRSKTIYQQIFKRPARVAIIHGGLECGVIASKMPDLDIIAIGPTVQGAHSPRERLLIPSIAKVRYFLFALLASFNE